jgi:(2Fe-2S) ferredoxin
VVYPDGIWYRRVATADVREIVQEHLQGNRPIARLLDQVLAP